MVPNPEFTPRNTTTGVFEFWRLAGPKETRSGNFYSLFHSPVGKKERKRGKEGKEKKERKREKEGKERERKERGREGERRERR